MKSDNDCTRAGWIEAIISSDACDLHVSYETGTDLDGAFEAFCHDTQKMIRVRGWMISEIQAL